MTGPELAVVAEAVLAGELAARGVSGAERLCADLIAELARISEPAADDTPEAVFTRLAGES